VDYSDFLEDKKIKDIPTGHDPITLNGMLFDFQADIVKWAVRRGRAAIFCDCGLGKSPMQLEWATQVIKETGGSVLILAPLAVSKQTKREGVKFNMPNVNVCRAQEDIKPGLNIANYEMLHAFDAKSFSGVVLDESSIIKSYTGKIRTQIIESFREVPYRLACTATPAPNDYEELGNHAEFLGIMTRIEMLSMFFINDTANTGTWRLKGHAQDKFWAWISTWAVMMRKPSDLGYDDGKFILPKLNIHEHVIKYDGPTNGFLFVVEAKTMQERRAARKNSLKERVKMAADIVNNSDETWLIWCGLNDESAELTRLINDAVEVKGSDTNEHKERSMLGFADGKISCMVTKAKIAGFGMNFQTCHNMIFVGLSDSYEAYYQAVRRCWRFGQKNEVNAHIITAETEGAVVANIKRKERDAIRMAENMTKHMADISSQEIRGTVNEKNEYKTGHESGGGWDLWLGDNVETIKGIETDSVHYSLFSPPFESLFTYSNSDRDMGNCRSSDDFATHFGYLITDLHRVIMPGRLLSFHCMNLPATIQHDGYIGMKDFRGKLIKMFQDAGFIFHSEVCIWKDPLVQATRTKVLTLAHKQISKDSSRCAQGFPDYIVTMRKPGQNPEPVSKGRGFEKYIGDEPEPKDRKNDDPRKNKYSHHVWQRYASPVWFDINQTRTLNERAARAKNDEKHMCPLQLDTIERCLDLWTNEGDTVLSPFAGIGSEGYGALQSGRKFIGLELKPEYFEQAIKNLRDANKQDNQKSLFEVAK